MSTINTATGSMRRGPRSGIFKDKGGEPTPGKIETATMSRECATAFVAVHVGQVQRASIDVRQRCY